jgi:hypothetical protein
VDKGGSKEVPSYDKNIKKYPRGYFLIEIILYFYGLKYHAKMTLLKTVLFSWMESIFITKKIAKTEFKYRNVISLLKSNNIRYTKEEIDDVVKEFKIYKEGLKSIEGNMKMVKITDTISFVDAKKSAEEWLGEGSESLMKTWLINAIMDKKQHRDIGKVLANVSEIYVNKWLSERTGKEVKSVVGESYDSILDNKVRIQIKFRMDAWHFETTRRNSKKNEETNSTGHVAYKSDEFDFLVIFKPGHTFGITGSTIRCIPISALINPKKPNQLVTNINSKIKKMYDNEEKTNEILSSMN